MKNRLESKVINPDDLLKAKAWKLYCFGSRLNPLMSKYEKTNMKEDYNYIKSHPNDTSARTGFIAKYINFSEEI